MGCDEMLLNCRRIISTRSDSWVTKFEMSDQCEAIKCSDWCANL